MEDREHWFTLLAEKDWEAIGKLLYQKKKAKVQDPYLAQMTGFFETEFFSFAEPLPPAERSRQFESTNLLIELNQHGFSQGFVDRFVDERLKLMQETNHSALLNYAQTHQHRPLAKDIIQSFLKAKPEAVSASLRGNMTVRATEVTPGRPKTIRLFKSKQEENFYEAVRRVFPTHHPYPNVALSCVLDYQAIKDQLSEQAKSYFFRGIVDSVLFDVGSGYVPVYFIELDSSFHDDPQAQVHSHEGLIKDGPLPKAVSALCLISASTQCGLAHQWVKVNSAPPKRVATILSFERSSNSCSVLHTLKQPDDFEMLGEGEAGGIRLIRIHGERFVAEHSETKALNIGTDHAPALLQSKFYSFMGANLFSCYAHDRPGLRPRTVCVDKDNLVAADDFGVWFDRVLLEEAVASTRWIIHDDDAASEALADRAIAYLASCGVTVENKVSFDKFDASMKFDGSVIVLASAAERGSRLQSVSRRLRTAQQSGTRLYITGALFGRSYVLMKDLQSNLTQAAMEFVMALAIGKIRLHKDVDSRLRAGLIEVLTPHVPEIIYLLDPDSEPPL